jgi:hypothetical protein
MTVYRWVNAYEGELCMGKDCLWARNMYESGCVHVYVRKVIGQN